MENLIQAIVACNADDVRRILASGAVDNLDGYGAGHLSALSEACRSDSAVIVSMLLEYGASVNAESGQLCKRPLHVACDLAVDSSSLVQLLLRSGSQVNSQDEDGNTALHLACTRTNRTSARLLLEAGADVALEDVDGEDPLLRACYAADGDLIDLLLRYGAMPTAMCLATSMMHDCAVGVYRLYKVRPDLLVVDALLSAIKLKLWENRTNLQTIGHNSADEYVDRHIPPMHVACSTPYVCSLPVLIGLLEVVPDVHRKDYAGCSCLQHACSTVNTKAVQVLLDFGSNSSRDEWRPFWKAFPSLTSDNIGQYVTVIHLLVLSGFQMDEESIRMFNEAANQAPGLSIAERHRFEDCITKYSFNPLQLKDLCRTRIRGQISASIQMNISRLGAYLPKSLLGFLKFDSVIDPIPYDVSMIGEPSSFW